MTVPCPRRALHHKFPRITLPLGMKSRRTLDSHVLTQFPGLVIYVNQLCGGFNTVRLVAKAMGDSDGPVVFRNFCPPHSTERKSAAKVFYHLLGEYINH